MSGALAQRELVFLVADNAMQQLLEGFFTRAQFHRSLGCGAFAIDPRRSKDVFVASGNNDSGLYARSRELLQVHRPAYKRAVVMIDNDWEGSPGPGAISAKLASDIAPDWAGESRVIVLDPEIEAWFWQPDSEHVSNAMRYRGEQHYRQVLAASGHWPEDNAKPPRPKEAREHLARHHGIDKSNAIFKRAAANFSVKGCTDTAFHELRDTLRAWFPPQHYR